MVQLRQLRGGPFQWRKNKTVNMRGPKAEDKANREGWNVTGLASDCPYINLVTTYNFMAPPAGGAVLTHS